MMERQETTINGSYGVNTDGFTGFFKSMIGFAGAATVFGLGQFQNAMNGLIHPLDALRRFGSALDAVSEAMTSEVDAAGKRTVKNISREGAHMVDETVRRFGGGAETEEAWSGRKR